MRGRGAKGKKSQPSPQSHSHSHVQAPDLHTHDNVNWHSANHGQPVGDTHHSPARPSNLHSHDGVNWHALHHGSPPPSHARDVPPAHLAEAEEEQRHYLEIVNAFANYKAFSLDQRGYAQRTYDSLSPEHKELVGSIDMKLRKWALCIEVNSRFIHELLSKDPLFGDIYGSLRGHFKKASKFNVDKVFSTLRQVVREWAPEGADERARTYTKLLEETKALLPVDPASPYSIKVLCPGSGLGRLPWEFAKSGYASQGNEWSYYMLIASNFVLNQTRGTNVHTIYPYIHNTLNVKKTDDMFRPVKIPDVDPSDLPQGADFSYSAGGFLEVFGEQKDTWDAVVTCFFLDTANNIVAFIEKIFYILKPGGYWLNLGPLLYHYADMEGEMSLELTLEEVMSVVNKVGFKVQKEEFVSCGYTINERSMMNTHYDSAFFVARKE